MQKRLINSQLTNMKTYLMYKREMITLAENVFEFKNLPDYMDVAFINSILVRQGAIAFFYDDVLEELVALPFTVNGPLDIYGRPESIMARASNGRYYRGLKKGEFIIMYDNNSYNSIYVDICQMAERISLSKRTIDVNIVQQRTPRIWKTTADKKRTIQDMMADIDGMMENVITFDSLDLNDTVAVMAPAPFVADKIDLHLDKEWSEFYRLVGIANLIQTKKERMIKDEMSASQGGTIASRYSRFEPRKRAVEKINKMFEAYLEKPIEVRYYDGVPSTEEEIEEIVPEVEEEADV